MMQAQAQAQKQIERWGGPGDFAGRQNRFAVSFGVSTAAQKSAAPHSELHPWVWKADEHSYIHPALLSSRAPFGERHMGFYPLGRRPIGHDEAVIVELLQHSGRDRLVRVHEPFAFVDAFGRIWIIPAGFVSDGASIPRWAWSPLLIGHPLMGDYRRAAVVHDFACELLLYFAEGKFNPRTGVSTAKLSQERNRAVLWALYVEAQRPGAMAANWAEAPQASFGGRYYGSAYLINLPEHYLDARAAHRTIYDGSTADGLTSWKRGAIWRACDVFGPGGRARMRSIR